MKAYNYAYLSGKIRALEPRILDDTDIERMADAPDFEGAFKVLNDTDYANNLLDIEPRNFRDALRRDFTETFKVLSRSVPDRDLLRILYLDRDFLNLRYLFKKKRSNPNLESHPNDPKRTDTDNDLVSDTIYPHAWLEAMVMEDKDRGLDEDIRQVIIEARKEFAESESSRKIDSFLSFKYFELLSALSKKLGNEFIKKWIKIRTDNVNLTVFLRAKNLGLALDLLIEMIVPGGQIRKEELTGIFEGDEGDIAGLKLFLERYYDAAVQANFDSYQESKNLSEFERGLENYITRFLDGAKRIAYGPEVVVAYFVAKSVAVKNVRVIMTGKDNLIPAAQIKSMVRQTY